jgi:TRAP-type mannitol/chloroaromatic compound transport system permease small subunit
VKGKAGTRRLGKTVCWLDFVAISISVHLVLSRYIRRP